MNRILLLIIVLLMLVAGSAVAAEVTFDGYATIYNSDIRVAQRNSLNNALIGGIRKYVATYAPTKIGDVSSDYFAFIKEYRIISREIVDSAVVTKVSMVIDESLVDDVATHVAHQLNSAVFTASGVSEYIQDTELRKSISAVFNEYQFSTKDQIPFEQEIIDITSSSDLKTALQTVSAQYMFLLNFNLTEFKAGESCTLAVNSSYIASSNINKEIPILRTSLTVEGIDYKACITGAVEEATSQTLTQVRQRLIVAPTRPLELQKYEIKFIGNMDFKVINATINEIKKKRLVTSSSMKEYFGNRATYTIEGYYGPEELASRFDKLSLSKISNIAIDPSDNSLVITLE